MSMNYDFLYGMLVQHHTKLCSPLESNNKLLNSKDIRKAIW